MAGHTIKIDEFERLRKEFIKDAQIYESASKHLENEANRGERARLVFDTMSKKASLEENLKSMTTLVMKLSEKVKRERSGRKKEDG